MAVELTEDEFGVIRLDNARGLIMFDGEVFSYEVGIDESNLDTELYLELESARNDYQTADGQFINFALEYVARAIGGEVVSIPDPDNEDLPEDAIL